VISAGNKETGIPEIGGNSAKKGIKFDGINK